MNFRKLITYLTMGTAAAMPLAVAQNPTILQGNYITNVFGNSNFVLNPNAQTNIANVTVSSATVTRSTTTPLVATSEFNITTSTSTGYADWSTRTFDAGMKGQNCEARFTYRGFSVGSTTAQILQGANVVAQLTLTASTDPRIASINFPCGDLSAATKFRLQQATASLTGTNEIGGIYIGLATNMANVAQAENVVTAKRSTTQSIPSATETTVIYATEELDVYGEYDSTTGVFTAKRAGQYQVIAQTLLSASAGWAAAEVHDLKIRKNTNAFVSNRVEVEVNAAGSPYLWNSVAGTIELAVGDTLDIRMFQNNGAAINIEAGAQYNRLSIARFPSSSELVVTPERQNVFGFTSGTNLDYTTKSASYVTPSGFSMDPATGRCENDGTNAACKIATLPAGRYAVQVSAPMFSAGSNGGNQSCYWGISDGIGTDVALGQTVAANATGTFDGISSITRVFSYSSVRTNVIFKLIVKEAGTGGASANCTVATGSSNGRYWQMSVIPLDQPSNSALYVQGPVKAAETGAAIPEGYVNEFATRSITSTSNVIQSSPVAGTWYSPWTGTLTLPAGNWTICYRVLIESIQTGATAYHGIWSRILNDTDTTSVLENVFVPTGGGTITNMVNTHSGCQNVAITSSKTFKVQAKWQNWSASPTVTSIAFRGDQSKSELYALRLN